jgi:hypothetical protein
LDIEQAVRTILADEDFSRVLMTWISREHISRRLLTNPAYWTALDVDVVKTAIELAGKVLAKSKGQAPLDSTIASAQDTSG